VPKAKQHEEQSEAAPPSPPIASRGEQKKVEERVAIGPHIV
jgi:hypothetical protein